MLFRVHANLLEYHRSMLADTVRTDAYRRAIHEIVRPGDVVVDIGTGTGILACFACEAGARRVYAIDDGDILAVAERVVRDNGFADRVTLLSEHSSRVSLEEPADVIVTETLGNAGFEEDILGSIVDARRRLLRSGGAVIPQTAALHVAPVQLDEAYASIDGWSAAVHGMDVSTVRGFAACNVHALAIPPEALLGDGARIVEVDLSRCESTEIEGSADLVVRRAGTLHGLAGWFSARLSPSVSLTNAPPNPAKSWANAFFPLERPWTASPDDRLRASVRSVKSGGIWRWTLEGDGPQGRQRADQSTAFAFPVSKSTLRQQDLRYAPVRSRRGDAELFVLQACDGRATLAQIEAALGEAYPDVFRSAEELADFVRRVVARGTRG